MASCEIKALKEHLDAELPISKKHNCIPDEFQTLRDKYIKQMLKIIELLEEYYKSRHPKIDLATDCPFAIRWKQTQVITYLLLPLNKQGVCMNWYERYYELLPQLTSISCSHTLKKFDQRDLYFEQFLKVVERASAYGEKLLQMPYENAVEHARQFSCPSPAKDKMIMELCQEGKFSVALSSQIYMALGERFVALAEAHQAKIDRKNQSAGCRVRRFCTQQAPGNWISRVIFKIKNRSSYFRS